jgi:hypothetical protein
MALPIRSDVGYYLKTGNVHLSAAANPDKGNIYEVTGSLVADRLWHFEHVNHHVGHNIYPYTKLYLYTIIGGTSYYATFYQTNKSLHNYTEAENKDPIVYLRTKDQLNSMRSSLAMQVQLWPHVGVPAEEAYTNESYEITTHDLVRIHSIHRTQSVFGQSRLFSGYQTVLDVVNCTDFQLVPAN